MRVLTNTTASTHALAVYLRRCGCVVEFVDETMLDVGVQPGSLEQRHATDEISAYVRVWELMRDTAVHRLEPRGGCLNLVMNHG